MWALSSTPNISRKDQTKPKQKPRLGPAFCWPSAHSVSPWWAVFTSLGCQNSGCKNFYCCYQASCQNQLANIYQAPWSMSLKTQAKLGVDQGREWREKASEEMRSPARFLVDQPHVNSPTQLCRLQFCVGLQDPTCQQLALPSLPIPREVITFYLAHMEGSCVRPGTSVTCLGNIWPHPVHTWSPGDVEQVHRQQLTLVHHCLRVNINNSRVS